MPKYPKESEIHVAHIQGKKLVSVVKVNSQEEAKQILINQWKPIKKNQK